MLNDLLQIYLKLFQKKRFKKIGNKIADKIIRRSKTSPNNYSEGNEEEILRERYILSRTKTASY